MADTRYYRIAPKIWRHAMTHQWKPTTTLVALYLLTCPHRNVAGLYVLPKPYILADLGIEETALDEALTCLVAEDFLRYDAATQVVLVVNALAYDAPENANQRKGALKYLQEVPRTALWRDLITLAETHAPTLAQDIAQLAHKRFPELFREPLPEPIPQRNGNSVSVSVAVLNNNNNNAREVYPTLEAAYVETFGGTFNPDHFRVLQSYLEDSETPLDLEVVVDAFTQCRLYAQHKSWGYVQQVLRNRVRDHLTTMALVQAAEQKRQRASEPRNRGSTPSPPVYREYEPTAERAAQVALLYDKNMPKEAVP